MRKMKECSVGAKLESAVWISVLLCLSTINHAVGGSATLSNGTDVNIPDTGVGNYVHSPITFSTAPSGATVTRIDYSFSITHSWGADLDVDLNDHTRTPAIKANLWTGTLAGGTDSGVNPSRSGSITSGSLIGLPVNQTWYLAAADVDSGAAGYINTWTMTVYWTDSQPDLTKSTDNLSNLNPYPGDTITASITIQNPSCGSASAGSSHIGFYWSTSSDFGGVSPFYEAPMGSVAANGTTSINQNLTINPTPPGTYYLGYKIDDQGEVAECNEGNNGFYYWTVNVQSPATPEMDVRGNGSSIADGDTTPSTGDYTDFGSTPVGTTVTRTFWIYNTGTAALTLGTITAPSGYTVTRTPASSITAGGSDYFNVRLNAAGSGTYASDISISNNDSNENPYNFRITGTVTVVNQPNLTPYQPSGWSGKIVVSRARGNNTDSTSLTTADTLYVDWAVLNNGNAAATSTFYTYLYVDDVFKYSWYTSPPLNANYYTAAFDYPIGSLSAGTHMIKITTDAIGVIGENSEADNSYTKTISVGGTALPDFRITSITLNPASPQPGQAFTANVTVQNQGPGSGDGRYLDVWAHQPSTRVCVSDGDTWTSIGVLSSGQSKTFPLYLTAPPNAGLYTFRAFVDSYCQTTEADDGNNQTPFGYTVGSPAQPQPNFLVTTITFNPPQPVGGQPFTASVTVKNQGAVSGDGKYLDVWANQPSPQTCGAPGGQSQSVGTLSMNQSKTLTYNLTAPPSGAPWTFRAFVDSTCQTPESNDGDNQLAVSYGINPVAQPDFTITSITTSSSNFRPGITFYAYITVKNLGPVSGNAGWLDVWANKPTTAACGELGDSHPLVGTLAASESKVITVALTAGSAGEKTLRAFIDSKCTSTENDELNNQKTFDYDTSTKVLLLLHGMNSDPTTWEDFVRAKDTSFRTIFDCAIEPDDSEFEDSQGVKYYAVRFGCHDERANGGYFGLDDQGGETFAASGATAGDFSDFEQLGDEVKGAITAILSANGNSTKIVIVAHSRGGLAARAFLQRSPSSPERSAVVGFLTLGTPHLGSKLGRVYERLRQNPRTSSTVAGQDWDAVDKLRGVNWRSHYNIDVRRPVIKFVENFSPLIDNLNSGISSLPSGLAYGIVHFQGTRLGVLSDIPVFGRYDAFDQSNEIQTADRLRPLSQEAENFVLDGILVTSFEGDGIVHNISQRYYEISGFPGGSIPASRQATVTGVVHTGETHKVSEIADVLRNMVHWWDL